MTKAIVRITRDFDYSVINRFKTEKLKGIVSSKKIGLPLVDVYIINPSVYSFYQKTNKFSLAFKRQLRKAAKQLLTKYGSVTLRTCFKFVGLENPRGLLSWRNLKSSRVIFKSIKAAFEHGEEVAKKNKISRFKLGLIMMGRIKAEKGGIVVVDIEKEKICSLDCCWGDAKLIAMGEGNWDSFWVNENLKIIGKEIREKSIGYFFRGNERKKNKNHEPEEKISQFQR